MISRALVLTAIFFALASACAAQEVRSAVATVVGVAGSAVYLDIGADSGLTAGDTLRLADRRYLIVLEVASGTSVVTFAGAPFSLTRGQRLSMAWSPSLQPAEREEADQITDRLSVFDRPTPASRRPDRGREPHISGRVQVGSSATWSSVESRDGSVVRTFATPFAGARLRLDGLPAGLYATVDGRVEYRYRGATPFDRPGEVRLRRVSVGADLGMVEIEAGRLRDPHDRFTGSVDGLRLQVGRPERGLNLSAGFEPEWRAGTFSNELPRFGGSVHSRFNMDEARGHLALLGGHVRPRDAALQARTYGGGQLRLAGHTWRLAVDALLDQDPATGSPAPSRLFASGHWNAAPGLMLNAHAARRRPYILAGSLQTMRPPSDRIGGGLSYSIPHLGRTTFRADAAYATARGTGSTSVAAGASVGRLPMIDTGLDLYGTVWIRRGATGATVVAALSREISSIWLAAGYRAFVSQQPLSTLVVHGLESTLQVSVAPGMRWTTQLAADLNDQVVAARAYTGLSIRL